MSASERQRPGADQRGDDAGVDAGMDAGMDARGKATQEQLPIARGRATQGAVADKDAARAAKVRRNAWLLAGFAVLVYVAYMVWFVVRGGGG